MAKSWTADLAASFAFLTRLPMPGGLPSAPLAEAMRALLVDREGVTLRVEGAVTLDDAVEIVRAMSRG